MRKLVTITIASIALTLGSALVLAHSGGLDSNGGHNDRKNGGYHYHRKKADPPQQATEPVGREIPSPAAVPHNEQPRNEHQITEPEDPIPNDNAGLATSPQTMADHEHRIDALENQIDALKIEMATLKIVLRNEGLLPKNSRY